MLTKIIKQEVIKERHTILDLIQKIIKNCGEHVHAYAHSSFSPLICLGSYYEVEYLDSVVGVFLDEYGKDPSTMSVCFLILENLVAH